MSLPRLAVLISGTGRNLRALCEATQSGELPAQIVLVISSRASAPGLQYAREYGIAHQVIEPKTYVSREDYDDALSAALDAARPNLIALAGFMRILTEGFVRRYQGRLFNIHPSLLPKYPGLGTHAMALKGGDTCHGASVHYVTPELDGGPVILQGSVAIQPDDTPDSLSKRVMEQIELNLYIPVLSWAATGRLHLTDEHIVMLDGEPLRAPLQLLCSHQ